MESLKVLNLNSQGRCVAAILFIGSICDLSLSQYARTNYYVYGFYVCIQVPIVTSQVLLHTVTTLLLLYCTSSSSSSTGSTVYGTIYFRVVVYLQSKKTDVAILSRHLRSVEPNYGCYLSLGEK